MAEKKKVIIEIDLDTHKYEKELREVSKETERLRKRQSALKKENRTGSVEWTKNKVQLEKYRVASSRLTKTLAGTGRAARKASTKSHENTSKMEHKHIIMQLSVICYGNLP